MNDTVAQQLVRYLEGRGVRHVFGLCGHTNIAVLAALEQVIEVVRFDYDEVDAVLRGAETSGIEGTGVGLTLSLGLAEAMRGTIEVSSHVGAGSTFTLVLPASEPERLESQVSSATSISVATARPVRVLYIEDNLANARLMTRICELRDHAVLEVAATGEEGLTKAAASAPDLILLDLHLPDMYGEEVLRALRTSDTTHESRIVIVTADATTAARSAARELGADGFIAKPIEVADVLAWLYDPERTGGFDG